ncbi:MAG: hypothetical protein AAF081_05140 [Actinomycetota bacterium]
MPRYIVSRRQMSNGDHEVHNLDSACPYLPSYANQILLGDHESCETAVKAARQFFTTANGCYNCATGCHVHGGVAATREGIPYRR